MSDYKDKSGGILTDTKPAVNSKGSEWCVPLSALQMPGEDEHMNTPGVGDKVTFQAEGTVSRIEGDEAYVKPESANGKPLNEKADATHDDETSNSEQEFAALRGEAEQKGMM